MLDLKRKKHDADLALLLPSVNNAWSSLLFSVFAFVLQLIPILQLLKDAFLCQQLTLELCIQPKNNITLQQQFAHSFFLFIFKTWPSDYCVWWVCTKVWKFAAFPDALLVCSTSHSHILCTLCCTCLVARCCNITTPCRSFSLVVAMFLLVSPPCGKIHPRVVTWFYGCSVSLKGRAKEQVAQLPSGILSFIIFGRLKPTLPVCCSVGLEAIRWV